MIRVKKSGFKIDIPPPTAHDLYLSVRHQLAHLRPMGGQDGIIYTPLNSPYYRRRLRERDFLDRVVTFKYTSPEGIVFKPKNEYYTNPNGDMKPPESECKTFGEWKARGFWINKGSKAYWFNRVAKFHTSQVRLRRTARPSPILVKIHEACDDEFADWSPEEQF